MSDGFTFRLQTLLRLRKRHRDQQRRVVAQALRDVARSEAHIVLLSDDLRSTVSATRGQQRDDSLDVVALRRHQFYRGVLQRQILEAETNVTNARQLLERERVELAERNKQLKVVEALRDKQHVRYRERIQRIQRIEEDEVGVTMFLRNRRRRSEGALV